MGGGGGGEKNKHGRRRRGCKCTLRLEGGWTDGERARPMRGGNPLSAKLCSAGMYSRLFTHVTRLAAAQRAVCLGEKEGKGVRGEGYKW